MSIYASCNTAVTLSSKNYQKIQGGMRRITIVGNVNITLAVRDIKWTKQKWGGWKTKVNDVDIMGCLGGSVT